MAGSSLCSHRPPAHDLPRRKYNHTIGQPFPIVKALRKLKKQIQYTIVIELNNLTKETSPHAFLKKVARSVLRQEKHPRAGLSIVLLEKKRMLQLNRIYRKKDRVANVLSFPIPELGLGEVMLCPAEIRKDARKYGIPYTKAMAWMLIHGVLHVLGYTHSQMTKKEKSYRSRIS